MANELANKSFARPHRAKVRKRFDDAFEAQLRHRISGRSRPQILTTD
jgi:hypothetical protein